VRESLAASSFNEHGPEAVPPYPQVVPTGIQRRRIGAIMLYGVLVIPNTVCQITRADSAARVSRKRKDYGNTQWDTTSAAIAEMEH
jgi:hypothetical protein